MRFAHAKEKVRKYRAEVILYYDMNLRERFLRKFIVSSTGCWEWIASSRGAGYGSIRVGTKIVDAHRVAYTLFKGDIPDGLLVCHTCDNRKCVNPDHLFLGTYKDNYDDAVAKGRMKTTTEGITTEAREKLRNKSRENSINRVYEIGLILAIKEALMCGMRNRDISELYGVNRFLVSNIKTGKNWAWL